MAELPGKAEAPLMIVIGGPNGAGKSTFTRRFLLDLPPDFDLVNPDDIARGVDPGNPAAAAVTAGMEAVRRMRANLSGRRSFLVETTLAGAFHIRLAQKARAEGWSVILYFVFVQEIQLLVSRVATRAAAGGHDVPAADIVRRFPKSIENLFKFLDIADKLYIFENSTDEFRYVAGHAAGEWYIERPNLFRWLERRASL